MKSLKRSKIPITSTIITPPFPPSQPTWTTNYLPTLHRISAHSSSPAASRSTVWKHFSPPREPSAHKTITHSLFFLLQLSISICLPARHTLFFVFFTHSSCLPFSHLNIIALTACMRGSFVPLQLVFWPFRQQLSGVQSGGEDTDPWNSAIRFTNVTESSASLELEGKRDASQS